MYIKPKVFLANIDIFWQNLNNLVELRRKYLISFVVVPEY